MDPASPEPRKCPAMGSVAGILPALDPGSMRGAGAIPVGNSKLLCPQPELAALELQPCGSWLEQNLKTHIIPFILFILEIEISCSNSQKLVEAQA